MCKAIVGIMSTRSKRLLQQDIDRYEAAINSFNVDSLIDIIIASHSDIRYDSNATSCVCISEHITITTALLMEAKKNSRKAPNPSHTRSTVQGNPWMLDTGRAPTDDSNMALDVRGHSRLSPDQVRHYLTSGDFHLDIDRNHTTDHNNSTCALDMLEPILYDYEQPSGTSYLDMLEPILYDSEQPPDLVSCVLTVMDGEDDPDDTPTNNNVNVRIGPPTAVFSLNPAWGPAESPAQQIHATVAADRRRDDRPHPARRAADLPGDAPRPQQRTIRFATHPTGPEETEDIQQDARPWQNDAVASPSTRSTDDTVFGMARALTPQRTVLVPPPAKPTPELEPILARHRADMEEASLASDMQAEADSAARPPAVEPDAALTAQQELANAFTRITRPERIPPGTTVTFEQDELEAILVEVAVHYHAQGQTGKDKKDSQPPKRMTAEESRRVKAAAADNTSALQPRKGKGSDDDCPGLISASDSSDSGKETVRARPACKARIMVAGNQRPAQSTHIYTNNGGGDASDHDEDRQAGGGTAPQVETGPGTAKASGDCPSRLARGPFTSPTATSRPTHGPPEDGCAEWELTANAWSPALTPRSPESEPDANDADQAATIPAAAATSHLRPDSDRDGQPMAKRPNLSASPLESRAEVTAAYEAMRLFSEDLIRRTVRRWVIRRLIARERSRVGYATVTIVTSWDDTGHTRHMAYLAGRDPHFASRQLRRQRAWQLWYIDIAYEMSGGSPDYSDDSEIPHPQAFDWPPPVPDPMPVVQGTQRGVNADVDALADITNNAGNAVRATLAVMTTLALTDWHPPTWGLIAPVVVDTDPDTRATRTGVTRDILDITSQRLLREIRAWRHLRFAFRRHETMALEMEEYRYGQTYVGGFGGGGEQHHTAGNSKYPSHTNQNVKAAPALGHVIVGTADGTIDAGTGNWHTDSDDAPPNPAPRTNRGATHAGPPTGTADVTPDRHRPIAHTPSIELRRAVALQPDHTDDDREREAQRLQDIAWRRDNELRHRQLESAARQQDPTYRGDSRQVRPRSPIATRATTQTTTDYDVDDNAHTGTADINNAFLVTSFCDTTRRISLPTPSQMINYRAPEHAHDTPSEDAPRLETHDSDGTSYLPANTRTAHAVNRLAAIQAWHTAIQGRHWRHAPNTNQSIHGNINRRYGEMSKLELHMDQHPDLFHISAADAHAIQPGATSLPPAADIIAALGAQLDFIEKSTFGPLLTLQRAIRKMLSARTRQQQETSTLSAWPTRAGITGKRGVHYHMLPCPTKHKGLVQWYIDSGAAASAMKHPYGLCNLRVLDRAILVQGVIQSAVMSVNTEASLDNITVLLDPRFSSNCLAYSSLIDAGWTITYIQTVDAYLVASPTGRRLCFQRHSLPTGSVTTHYACHPQLPFVDPTDASAWAAQ